MAPLKLTNKDIDLIVRLVATEADHKLAWSHPEEYSQQVHGIVDTVLNRVAAGNWGSSVESVANAKNQFSAINGPTGRGYKVYGSVDNVPDSKIPEFLPNIVNSWVTARKSGTPSSIGGNLNYANPKFSDAKNLNWINALDGPKLGYGDSTHYHGTVAGLKPVEAVLAPSGITAQQRAAIAGSGAPLPASMSPALQAARTRLATARQQMKDTTAAGMTPADKLELGMSAGASRVSDPLKVGAGGLAVTPRIPGTNYDFTQNVSPTATAAEVTAAKSNTPSMDVSPVQARAIALDEGVGSLGNPRSFSPGTMNPVKPPVTGLRMPQVPAMDPKGTGATLADLNAMKQGSMPPLPRPRPETPTTTTADPAKAPTATPAKMVKLASGKMAPVGATNVMNGAVWTVTDNGDGTGKMVKFDPGILKEINSDSVAGGIVRQKVGEGITAGKDAVVAASKPVIDTVAKTTGDLLGQAGNMLGGLFGGATLGKPESGAGIKLSIPIDQPKPATIMPAAKPIAAGATLSAPGAGLSAAQRNAMTSLAGTGMSNAIAPTPATMPAGLRTAALPKSNPITVSKPTPAVQTQPKLYQSGGYVYVANPSGGYTKVGKVGQGNYNTTATTAKPAATVNKTSSSSSSSSSGSIPKGYIDLGGGKVQSPETGGIYYTRNL